MTDRNNGKPITGVIEKCTKYRAQFFFIRGDDGKRYFGHRHQIVNPQHYKYYCYEGNRVRFIPGELPEKEGEDQTANFIEFETVDKYDRLAEKMVEVVRCKDCEHCYFASNRIPSEQNYACGKHGFDVVQDWYCADGEPK